MAASNLAQILSRLFERLKEEPSVELPEAFTVLDHLLFGVAQEGARPSLALEAYKNLVNAFFNFNEMRVAHPKEFVALLDGLPNVEDKAKRMLDILQFVFETTYGFDLESMKKKPFRQAQKQLSKVAGATKFAVAATVQRALAGDAVPIDEAGREFLASCGAAAEPDSLDAAATQVETTIAGEAAAKACLALQEVAHDPKRRKALAAELSGGDGAAKKKPAKRTAKKTG